MDNGKYIELFTTYLKRSNKTKSTIVAYIKDLTQLCDECKGKLLSELDENDIKEILKDWLYADRFSIKTISRKLNSFRTFYHFLLERKEIEKSPTENIRHPKFRKDLPKILARSEYSMIRDAFSENLKYLTIFEILLQTGIRIGELSRIRVKDLSLDKDNPHILIQEYSSINERSVPLNNKAVKAIKLYLSSLNGKNPEHPLFATRNNKNIQIRNIRGTIDRAIKKTRIKDTCVNDIRNTFITYQLSQGYPVDELAKIVGHKTTVTTQRYLEILPKQYKDRKIKKIHEL